MSAVGMSFVLDGLSPNNAVEILMLVMITSFKITVSWGVAYEWITTPVAVIVAVVALFKLVRCDLLNFLRLEEMIQILVIGQSYSIFKLINEILIVSWSTEGVLVLAIF